MVSFIIMSVAIIAMHGTCTPPFHEAQWLLQKRRKRSAGTELKTVAGALASRALEAAEETEESNVDYCKLKGDTPEKA